jgi:5-hydroxyisourate hydrolase
MGRVSTHVLDTSRGLPAGGVAVTLEAQNLDGRWLVFGQGETDADGRFEVVKDTSGSAAAALYRLTLSVAAYFGRQGGETFFPEVVIMFIVADPSQHYHVPLLVSPFAYSTYRGS